MQLVWGLLAAPQAPPVQQSEGGEGTVEGRAERSRAEQSYRTNGCVSLRGKQFAMRCLVLGEAAGKTLSERRGAKPYYQVTPDSALTVGGAAITTGVTTGTT